MSKNILKAKSYLFAIEISKLSQRLQKDNKELVAMLVSSIKISKSKL